MTQVSVGGIAPGIVSRGIKCSKICFLFLCQREKDIDTESIVLFQTEEKQSHNGWRIYDWNTLIWNSRLMSKILLDIGNFCKTELTVQLWKNLPINVWLWMWNRYESYFNSLCVTSFIIRKHFYDYNLLLFSE